MTAEAIVELLRVTKATLNVDHEGRITVQSKRNGRVVPTDRFDGDLVKALDDHARKVLQ